MAIHIRRREFIFTLGGAAAAWPLAARAQQGDGMRRIGVLMGIAESDAEAEPRRRAFVQELRALGWIEGSNLRIHYRWGVGDANSIRLLAGEIVGLTPDLIVAYGSAGVQALQPQTRTIPIVFVAAPDPVNLGFVSSLAHPGGNITGFTGFEPSMAGKWLEALTEIAPGVRRAAVLFTPDLPAYRPRLQVIEALAPSVNVHVIPASARNAAEIVNVLESFAEVANSGLIVLPSVFNTAHRETIVALAAKHRLPAVYPFRYFATGGGLVSYGIDIVDLYRRSAMCVDRVLRGQKPADLPVQAPTKFEMIINLKTAKALGLEIPPTLLARADGVIE